MLYWQETPEGWQAGRFEVRRADLSGWDLMVFGTHRSHHSKASSARAMAAQLERVRHRRVGVLKLLGVAVALIGVTALLLTAQLERNPARDEAELLAAGIDAAYASVEGGVSIAAVDMPGLTAALVPLPGGAAAVSMITGMAGGECYAFYWNDDRGPVARALVAGLRCEPGAAVTTSAHNVYHRQTPVASGHLAMFGAGFDWESVLPPELRIRPWILPAVILLGGVALSLAVKASLLALGA